MPAITPVLESSTFLDWRNKTNDLIDTFNMPTVGAIAQLGSRVDTFNITESAGVHIGCAVTDNGDGTVNISAGEAILRTSNSSSAPLVSVEFPAVNNLILNDTTNNFIFANYNAGTPAIQFSTLSSDVNDTDRGMVAVVQKNGLNLTILQLAGDAGDFERRITHRLRAAEGFSKASGADMSEPSPLRLNMASGEFYYGVSEFITPNINTATVGAAIGTSTGGSTTSLIDTTKNFVTEGVVVGDQVWNTTNTEKGFVTSITTTTNPNDTLNFAAVATTMAAKNYDVTHSDFEYYHNSNLGWIETGSNAIDNASFNTFGVGLTAHTAGYFKADWVYLKIGTNQVTPYILRGTAEYSSLASAQGETAPQTKPYPLKDLGVLVGRLITQQGNPNIVSVDNLLNSQNFASAGSTEFADDVFRVTDNADSSKKVGFELSGLTTGTERVLEVPNKNGRLAMYEDVFRRHDEVYKGAAMGALSKRVVPYNMTVSYGTYENGTNISVNGKTALSGLAEDVVGTLPLLQGDLIEANKPIAVKDLADGNVIAPLSSVGEHFWFPTNRAGPHEVTIYAPYYDVDIIYSTDTNFTVSENVWDVVVGGGGETNIIKIKKGTVKSFYVQYDPASTAGVIPPSANPVSEVGDHYIHTNGPVVVTKEGQGYDHFLVMPMSREILHPSGTSGGANYVKSFTGVTPTHVGNGYYIADDQFQTCSIADGAGGSGHTGIPYSMCGDTYMIEHDIAGYQICVIEPCDIRVICADTHYAEIDAQLASRTNPLYFNVGNGMNGVLNAPSLLPSVGYIDFDMFTATGTLNVGDTLTQAVTGAIATVNVVYNDRLILKSIVGAFDATNLVTSSTGATFTITKVPYRTWKFVATAPFALRTNDPHDDEYITVGYRRAFRSDSYDQTTQLNQNIHTLTDEIQERSDFISTFDVDLDYEWENVAGVGTIVNIDSDTVPNSSGANVRSVHGFRTDMYSEKAPYQSDTLYKVSAKVRLATAPTAVGNGFISIGVAGLSSNGITYVNASGINSKTGQFNLATLDLETVALNTWVTIEGFFKGHGAYVPDVTTEYFPSALHNNVRFIKPFISANGGAGDGVTELDWIKVERVLDSGATNGVFFENDNVINKSYTIPVGKNAMTAGPVTVADGVVITVPNGSVWTVL